MKKLTIFILILSSFLISGNLQAKTYLYPAEKPIFSINFPDKWTIGVRDNKLQAGPKDGGIFMGVWEAPEDLDLEDAGTAIGDLISDMVDDAQFGSPTPADYHGVSFLSLDGTGKDKTSGNFINVSASLFTPDNKSVFILLYFGSAESEIKYQLQLADIVNSIQPLTF